MARAIDQSPPSSQSDSDTYILDIINVNNLLTRLEQNIFLSSSPAYKLLTQSHLHCARVGANIEYAQILINRIEHSLPSVKAPAIRHERTTDLAKKRGRWEKVKERFDWIREDVERRVDWGEQDIEDIEPEIEEEEEEDNIWEGIIPVPISGKDGNTDIEKGAALVTDTDTDNVEDIEPEISNDRSSLQEETATLRQRRFPSTTTPSSAIAMASGTSTSSTTPKPSTTTTTTTTHLQPDSKETTLSTHRNEQETLTNSLINLASQLKASSQAFQQSLEQEKGILNRAVEGLDRNITGMEAAGKRMGVLRRMTEGRGWWGRMIMYAWIFGLWIVALAIVYLGPKLRF